MNFIPLNVYTNYALLQSALTLDEYVAALQTRKLSTGGIADPDFFFAYPHFNEKARSHNIVPLFGIRLNIAETDLVFFIKNRAGYRHLLQLNEALENDTFKLETLKDYTADLVVIYPTNNLKNLDQTEKELINIFKKWAMLTTHFYIGLERESNETSALLRQFATKYNYDIVAFPLIKYLKPEDAKTLAMVTAIKDATTLNIDANISGSDYFLTTTEALDIYNEKEIDNTGIIASLLDFNLSAKHDLVLPLPAPYDALTEIKKLTNSALDRLGLGKISNYRERLDYELEIITSLNFTNYFLIVADYVNFAKNAGILVGYGRGSAPGSLVSYLLGITSADPLKYNLLFERFLNPSRVSLPDIDIDFMDTRRGEVLDYIKTVYGEERVAQIVTFQTNAAKASLRDVSRIFNITPRFVDRLSKALGNDNYSLREAYIKLPAFKKLIDEDSYNLKIVKEAIKLVGFPRQTGLHAAGIIIDSEPLVHNLATFYNNGIRISQYEMGFLEETGFLKIDILGLTNLTFIDNIIKRANVNRAQKLDFYTLNLHDPKIYHVVKDGLTLGLFQLESEGMRRAIRQIEPTNFDDVSALLALYRPGPMAYIKDYASAKKGESSVRYIDPSLEPILKSTYGIIIYQEQIMEIVVKMAGFTLSQADLLRRAISKKDESLILKEQQAFLGGAIRNGYTKAQADKVFSDILKFAQYGFNKSHSVVYAMTTMALAYLKTYAPHSFYIELLQSSASDTKKMQEIRRELNYFNIKIGPPSIEHSINEFVNIEDSLVYPFRAIKGITADIGEKIISLRQENPFTSFENFAFRAYKAGLNEEHIIALIESGALDNFHTNRAYLKAKLESYLPVLEIGLFQDEEALFAIIVDEISENTNVRLIDEVARLSLPLSANPLDNLSIAATPFAKLDQSSPVQITTYGVLTGIREIRTKKGELMAFLTLSDYDNEITVVLFPRTYAALTLPLVLNEIYIITGRSELKDGEQQLIADTLERYSHA